MRLRRPPSEAVGTAASSRALVPMVSPGATGADPVDGLTVGQAERRSEAASLLAASAATTLTGRRRAEHRDEHPGERADRGEDGDACRQHPPPTATPD